MFKEWKLLRFYIKTIKTHTKDIKTHFIENAPNYTYQIIDMDYDKVYRFYTVLNFPENTTKNIQKYGYTYMDNETRKFIKELNIQFQKYGLFELVGLSKADQIGERSIHIVVEYKLLKTTKIAKSIIYLLFTIISILASIIIF
jgi:hypothetical protein